MLLILSDFQSCLSRPQCQVLAQWRQKKPVRFRECRKWMELVWLFL
ncbi:hypothetical protein [uncultured Gammaproteobacteria bacterium]|nr:hypothetical protein [uncultured Gammaproteobacteria bacterium]